MVLVLALVALISSVATGGTALHLHDQGGLWNEEHDLARLATTSPWALFDAALPIGAGSPITRVATPVVSSAPHPIVCSTFSRAPPTA